MSVQLTSEDILDRADLNSYLQKFNERVAEVDVSIEKISGELATARNLKEELLLKDMITAGDDFRKPLTNCITKIDNYKRMLEVEIEKRNTFILIMQNSEVDRLLKEFRDISNQELHEYQTVEERVIYSELAQIRERQLELLDKLNSTRNSIETELDEFTRIAQGLGYPQYSLTCSFHQNPQYPNPSFKELGAIMFNCGSIKNSKYLYEMSTRVY
ncbi:hypothetical protein [Clostridium tagluense]|uniref:Uncharacterized protein n=1 Tax=Clostridium tagluense TaxID=360422 RepID=A0A401UTW0_9CLOT|nr:hypothetical protein [Clostridium tagluense]GCD12990.1 hypothetical protein Ctaglu_46130 [Clostridium tagluense]